MITSNYSLPNLGDRLAPKGQRDRVEAQRILDRIAGHCVRVEIEGASHRRASKGVGKNGVKKVEGPMLHAKGDA